ncbi:hypothetical protein [uncultured Lacinutrix sp.]|uniref:hypothetical protein n=1 Tax=uncultured Lacinutrix sp. TaxID=574032 RepID=UPI00262E5D7F|nr:hypothetical protein [uncultured Lacinutrix sp.]
MKSTFEIMNLKKLFFLPFIVLALMVSCQTEETDITNPQEEIIEANSTAADLMSRTTLNDGSGDNIIDYANCLEVLLPVTVTANGVTITIESYTDYDALEELLDAFSNDNDEVVITFPITVILNDYTEIVINNQAELEAQVELCNGENEDDDDIECIDFQYPISISIYDSTFQVTDTITVENDEALYDFIESLENGVLASLNFPITMILSDGSTVEVNSNQELEAVIIDAEDDCDEDDDNDWNDDDELDCDEETVALALKECEWIIAAYTSFPEFEGFELEFDANYNFVITQDNQAIGEGSWSVAQDGDDIFLHLDTNFEDFGVSWLLVECDDDRFQFESGNNTMVLEQDCDNNNNSPFDCFASFDAVIEKCDEGNDGFEVYNLTTAFDNCNTPNFELTYHITEADADANANALANPEAYTNLASPQTIYVRVQIVGNDSEFEVFPIELLLSDCGGNIPGSGCTETEVDNILMECEWTITSYQGGTSFNIFNMSFMDNQDLIIESDNDSYTGNWSTSQDGDYVIVEFSNIPGGNIQILNGSFKVVECTAEQMIFHDVNDSNNELVLDRDCI